MELQHQLDTATLDQGNFQEPYDPTLELFFMRKLLGSGLFGDKGEEIRRESSRYPGLQGLW